MNKNDRYGYRGFKAILSICLVFTIVFTAAVPVMADATLSSVGEEALTPIVGITGIDGANRYDTSIKVNAQTYKEIGKDRVDTIVVASGAA